jgi:hypothetical protein
MVYASTKIKRIAAEAYEREVVATEEFNLVKPEGFIIPTGDDSQFAFKARSKDFGEDEAPDTPQVLVGLSVYADANFETICENARKTATEILSEDLIDNLPERKIYQVEFEKNVNEIPFYVFHKIVENSARQKVYDLKISVLRDFREKHEEQIGEILSSFKAL